MDQVAATEVGAELDALLDRVQRGEEIVITRGGEPVARLVPPVPDARPADGPDPNEVVARFRALRERIAARGERFTWEELNEMRDEGRP